MRDDFDAGDLVRDSIGVIEFIARFHPDPGDNKLSLMVELLDVNGVLVEHRYVRDIQDGATSTERILALLTPAQRAGLDTVGARFRMKARNKFFPA